MASLRRCGARESVCHKSVETGKGAYASRVLVHFEPYDLPGETPVSPPSRVYASVNEYDYDQEYDNEF